MLQRIRDRSSGPLAYVIVGLIALVFSVWGVGSYFTESANPSVAEVDGAKITKYQLQRAYDQRYQRLQQLMGDNFDSDEIEPQQFRRRVLQGLIQKKLMSQYAEDAGYRVTDAGLLKMLRNDSRFQVDGSFSPDRYRAALSRAGVSPSAFEADLRKRGQVKDLRRGILDTALVSERGVLRTLALKNQERRVAYLAFEPDSFRGQVTVGKAEVESYYRDHPDRFMREQRVKLNYVVLDRDALGIEDAPGEQYLKKLYEQEQQSRFKSPERRLARHILIRVDDETDADTARQRIQEIATKVEKADTDFAEVARRASDDEATADKGGKLDWVSRGTMVAPFEDALFKLDQGEVSKPVKTEFGWHLIKLEKVDAADVKPFDDAEVQSELKKLYRKQSRKERYKQMSEQLDALSFEAPESLQPIADKLGLEIQETDWVTRGGGQGIAANQSVIKAAFSDSVLKDGLNSTPVQLSGGRQVVLRVADKQAAQRRPLDAVRDAIKERLVVQTAQQLAEKKAGAALTELRDGRAMDAIAENGPAELRQVGWIGRNGNELPDDLRQAAFALSEPDQQDATYGEASTSEGPVAVMRLRGVRTPEAGASEAGERVTRKLRDRLAGLEYGALRRSLKDDYEVTIHDERLK